MIVFVTQDAGPAEYISRIMPQGQVFECLASSISQQVFDRHEVPCRVVSTCELSACDLIITGTPYDGGLDRQFIKYAKELPNVESKLFYLRQQRISNLMIYAMLPKLTEKQNNALILAIENGYYGYPRKVKLEKLARIMKISTSTYQFHLAKAEAKLMPFLVKRY